VGGELTLAQHRLIELTVIRAKAFYLEPTAENLIEICNSIELYLKNNNDLRYSQDDITEANNDVLVGMLKVQQNVRKHTIASIEDKSKQQHELSILLASNVRQIKENPRALFILYLKQVFEAQARVMPEGFFGMRASGDQALLTVGNGLKRLLGKFDDTVLKSLVDRKHLQLDIANCPLTLDGISHFTVNEFEQLRDKLPWIGDRSARDVGFNKLKDLTIHQISLYEISSGEFSVDILGKMDKNLVQILSHFDGRRITAFMKWIPSVDMNTLSQFQKHHVDAFDMSSAKAMSMKFDKFISTTKQPPVPRARQNAINSNLLLNDGKAGAGEKVTEHLRGMHH